MTVISGIEVHMIEHPRAYADGAPQLCVEAWREDATCLWSASAQLLSSRIRAGDRVTFQQQRPEPKPLRAAIENPHRYQAMGFENEWESFGHAETAVRTCAMAIRPFLPGILRHCYAGPNLKRVIRKSISACAVKY